MKEIGYVYSKEMEEKIESFLDDLGIYQETSPMLQMVSCNSLVLERRQGKFDTSLTSSKISKRRWKSVIDTNNKSLFKMTNTLNQYAK